MLIMLAESRSLRRKLVRHPVDAGETHRVAAGIVHTRDANEGVEVAEAARRIPWCGVLHVAVRLLQHVEKAMHHVARKAVIEESCWISDLEDAVEQRLGVGNACVVRVHRKPRGSGAQETEIRLFKRRLDCRQLRVRHESRVERRLTLVEPARRARYVGSIRYRKWWRTR